MERAVGVERVRGFPGVDSGLGVGGCGHSRIEVPRMKPTMEMG